MSARAKIPQAEIAKDIDEKIFKANKLSVRAVQYKPGRYHVIALYNPKLVSVLKGFPYGMFDKATKSLRGQLSDFETIYTHLTFDCTNKTTYLFLMNPSPLAHLVATQPTRNQKSQLHVVSL